MYQRALFVILWLKNTAEKQWGLSESRIKYNPNFKINL